MSFNWIQSYSGKGVTPLDLRPEQVTFEDIPHALAQKVRFNGHLRDMGYNVAQHCVLGTERIGGPVIEHTTRYTKEQLELKLAFLLHEVSEVYLPDVPAPIKPALRVEFGTDGNVKSWTQLEDEHALAMFAALGLSHLLPLLHSDAVKAMDRAMLVTEKRDLRGPDVEPQVVAQEKARYSGEPVPGLMIARVWGPEEAKHEFTVLYRHLREELRR